MIIDKGKSEILTRIKDLIDMYYGDLVECQVKIGLLMVYPSPKAEDKPPLVSGGVPIAIKVSQTSEAWRALGGPDVVFYIDSRRWENLDSNAQQALLDRGLCVLEIKRDKEGYFVTDGQGRPKFKFRKPDYNVAIYDTILRRHGASAIESQEFEELSLQYHSVIPTE